MKRFIRLLVFSCLTLLSNATKGSPLPPSSLSSYSIDGSRNSTATAFEDEFRRSLPPGLRNTKGAPLLRIDVDGVTLYLLGSSHVSRTSCDDAKLLMQHVRPDVLFVELCSQRVGLLLDPPAPSESDEQLKHNKDPKKEIESSSQSSKLWRGNPSLLYAKIQEDYAKKMNVTIGGEFRAAFQSALDQQCQFWGQPLGVHDPYSIVHPRENRPCSIILGDRPVAITLRRAWESLRLFGKVKLMLALLWSSIRQPSDNEIREWMESIMNDRSGKNDLITKAMEELGKAFPSLKRVIIEERDEFMVAKLRQTAEALMHSDQNGEKVIVAVVGAGHVNGMIERLGQKDYSCSLDNASSILSPLDRRPEKILPGIIETKKRKISNDDELSSLVTDIVQFDYSYYLENET